MSFLRWNETKGKEQSAKANSIRRDSETPLSVLIKKHTKMTTNELKAIDVLKTNYGIDAKYINNKVYVVVWNDAQTNTIDVEVSKDQVEKWAYEYDDVLPF